MIGQEREILTVASVYPLLVRFCIAKEIYASVLDVDEQEDLIFASRKECSLRYQRAD